MFKFPLCEESNVAIDDDNYECDNTDYLSADAEYEHSSSDEDNQSQKRTSTCQQYQQQKLLWV